MTKKKQTLAEPGKQGHETRESISALFLHGSAK
jgi:hypothetical protein